ncbi:TerB N-terminal domain-containing protein [Paenibacillus albidus]|uniref:TerB N-terminal domain-containing protein n=1 Tax=Paenibacillus albidus TaxID=2041023 RepID=UPI001BED082A|nr:TerB N-terminal domain-containing protein [Paenibacillus albidus]MBT2287812.1 TerB N-terminal domain-containing protein [Paenibacillus albidus]
MSKEGRQPHFTELIFESTEQNVAIPPRGSQEQPKLPAPGQTQSTKPPKAAGAVPQANVQLSLWDSEEQEPVTTTEAQFTKRARELEDRKEPASLFVPFKSYWPNYGHMTGVQSRWYFYWRNEVRQGRYPKTDLSYIFLHVYELINGVGWKEPLDGYGQLKRIWEAYRAQYKRLDQYLGGWIADFSFVHHLDISLSVIVARSRGLAGDLAELELMRCLSSCPEELTFSVLTALSDYDISKSKFYTGDGKEACEQYIPQVVALIDAYVARKHGSKLVEMFPPGPPVMRERYLFRSAVYDISLYGYSVLVPVVRISKSQPLRSLVTRLFRLTENKLRELMGFRGRLKGVNVDADMETLVTRFLQREFRKAEQEQNGPAVVIDQEKLTRLEQDSEIVRSMLTIDDTLYSDSADNGAEPETSELPEVKRQNPDQSEPAAKRMSDVADVGEALRDIAPTARSAEPSGPVPPALSADTSTEWEQFVSGLTPLQREVVSALAQGDGLEGMDRLAAAHGTMPELLMDEINELAMDILGDLLIDGKEITEEFVPMLSTLKR